MNCIKDGKKIDRASGSGVFARDPDAQLDMIELQLDGDMKYEAEAFGRTAWRLESSLREFPNIIPVDFWFDYPIHTLARPEELTQAPAKGSVAAKIRGGKNCSRDERAERIRMAFAACSFDPDTPVTVSAIASYLGSGSVCAGLASCAAFARRSGSLSAVSMEVKGGLQCWF